MHAYHAYHAHIDDWTVRSHSNVRLGSSMLL